MPLCSTGPMDAVALERWLADPKTYPDGSGEPELIHTHASVVALVGSRVFKVKREVRYPFLDFSTPALRLAAAREELRLNRRLAPGVYLGLQALRPGKGGGARFEPFPEAEEPPADTLAVAVHMVRLTAHDLLDKRLERGEVDHELLALLAERLARFHREAERGPDADRAADPARLERLALDNIDALKAWNDAPEAAELGALASPELVRFLRRKTVDFFRDQSPTLRARIAAGRAVDGHGDLHAGNVWVRGQELAIYDALEFNGDLRRGDGALDLAFLLMDLDRAGHRAAASWLAREYGRLAEDRDLDAVLVGFKVYRALVRAKVGGLRAKGESDPEARRAARIDGSAHTLLAASYELPPALVLMCGLPASGKSWLAERTARILGAALHRSDVLRRRIAGEDGKLPEGRHRGAYDQGRYAPDAKQRTYDALLADARRDLADGRTCIVDGSFVQARWRRPFADLAGELGVPYVLFEPFTTPEVAKERLERRALDPREPSEADWNVYLRLAEQYEPPDELPPRHHVRIESGGPPEDAVAALVDALLAQTD